MATGPPSADAPATAPTMVLEEGLQHHLEQGDVAPIYAWLEAGGHVDARDSKGRTLLMLAAAMGSEELLIAMLGRGSNLELQQHQGTTALMFAAFAGEQVITTRLLGAPSPTVRI